VLRPPEAASRAAAAYWFDAPAVFEKSAAYTPVRYVICGVRTLGDGAAAYWFDAPAVFEKSAAYTPVRYMWHRDGR